MWRTFVVQRGGIVMQLRSKRCGRVLVVRNFGGRLRVPLCIRDVSPEAIEFNNREVCAVVNSEVGSPI